MVVPPSSNEPPSLIRFGGNWMGRGSDLVGEAVSEAETAAFLSDDFCSALWGTSFHNQGKIGMYAASRRGVSGVLAARSASGLAEQIWQFARSAKEVTPKPPR